MLNHQFITDRRWNLVINDSNGRRSGVVWRSYPDGSVDLL